MNFEISLVSAQVPISPMTTSLPTNIADFASVLDDVVAAAGAAAVVGEDEEGGGDKKDSKNHGSHYSNDGGGGGGLNQNLPKFPRHHPLDSLLTPAASPEEDSLEPWIQTV